VYTGPFGAKFPLFKGNALTTETSTGHRSPFAHPMEVSAEKLCLLSLAKKVKSQVAVSGSSARVFLSVRMWGDGSGAGAPPVELCKAADCMVGA